MFSAYRNTIKNTDFSLNAKSLPENLKLDSDDKFSVYYTPFDYVNSNAKVIICGITPGLNLWKSKTREMKLLVN